MGETAHVWFSVFTAFCTAVLTLTAIAFFISDIQKGQARPYTWAWIIRAGVVALAFVAQASKGATYSLALSGAQLIGCAFLIAVVQRAHGRAGRLDRVDWTICLVAIVGLMVWVISGEALYAAIGTVVADGAATAMGVRAALTRGTSDSLRFWLCCLAAAGLAVVCASGQSFQIMLVPLASLTNAAVNTLVVLIMRRQPASGVEILQSERG